MGIRGLTTFIENAQASSPEYRHKVCIRNQPVVIDGCNLMYFLYFDGKAPVVGRGGNNNHKSDPQANGQVNLKAHLYGGDWILYAQNVRYFFQQLKQCEITAIVLFDGAYDTMKLRVATERFQKSVKDNVPRSNKDGYAEPGKTYTPVFLKNVFFEVLAEQKIPYYQCLEEADRTIAMVAKLLGRCPILSSDSDFFIYNGAVPVPLKSLKFSLKQPPQPKTNGKKKSKGEEAKSAKPAEKVWTLEGETISLPELCKKQFGLRSPDLLPMAAVIIGNDHIATGLFQHIKQTDTLIKRIECTFRWLAKRKTVVCAFRSLLDLIPADKQRLVELAIQYNLRMYQGENGENQIWYRIRTDVPLAEWIDKELESGLCHPDLSSFFEAAPKEEELTEGEPKEAEPKEAEPKAAEPKEAEPKAAEPKEAEPKAAEPKEAEPKAAEPKEAASKVAELKEPEPKAAEPKEDGRQNEMERSNEPVDDSSLKGIESQLLQVLGLKSKLKCEVREPTSEEIADAQSVARLVADDNGDVKAEVLHTAVPEWVKAKMIKCELQTVLLNMLKNHKVFFLPQVELFGAESTHDFSIPIIQIIAGILFGDPNKMIFIESHRFGKPTTFIFRPVVHIEGFGDLPTIKGTSLYSEDKGPLGTLPREYRVAIMMAALGIIENKEESPVVFYEGWPVSYRIWMGTLMHYIQLKLYVSNDKRDPLRCLAVIVSIFLCVIKNLIVNPGKIAESPKNKVLKSINALHQAYNANPDKLKKIREFYQRFEDYSFGDTVKPKGKWSYDINLPYSLSQYLCIVYHTELLNSLLGFPLKSPKIRYMVNNIFVYNLARYILHEIDETEGAVFNDIIAKVVGVDEIYDVLYEFIGICFNIEKFVQRKEEQAKPVYHRSANLTPASTENP